MSTPAKILLTVVLVAVFAFLLILLAAGFIEASLWIATTLGLLHALGMDTQTSHNYAASSGTLPMLVTALGFSGALIGMWRHVNCHTAGCWRRGKHPVAGGTYKVCTPCLREIDPGHAGRHTRSHIARLHARETP